MSNYITCNKCGHEELDCQCIKCSYCDNTSPHEKDFVYVPIFSRDENKKITPSSEPMCTECKEHYYDELAKELEE